MKAILCKGTSKTGKVKQYWQIHNRMETAQTAPHKYLKYIFSATAWDITLNLQLVEGKESQDKDKPHSTFWLPVG